MTSELVKVTQADLDAAAAEAFGKAFRAEQAANFGCAGEVECCFPMDGNCACFNATLAKHRLSHLPQGEGEVREDDSPRIVGAARVAMFGTEIARTDVVTPVNGTRSYSYVAFHGQRVEFHEGEFDINGDAGSAKAASYATKINDGLFELAKSAARLALNGVCANCGGYPLANPEELDCGKCGDGERALSHPVSSVSREDVLEAVDAAIYALRKGPAYAEWNEAIYEAREAARRSLKSSTPSVSEGEVERLRKALLAVVEAVREYLPPDGIDRDQFINRVIAATDNPTINPLIAEIENGRP